MDFATMFVLGLVSSLHCLQMCGPIVISYSAATGFAPKTVGPASKITLALLPHHLAYNSGRILTYTFLGTIAGLLGRGREARGVAQIGLDLGRVVVDRSAGSNREDQGDNRAADIGRVE